MTRFRDLLQQQLDPRVVVRFDAVQSGGFHQLYLALVLLCVHIRTLYLVIFLRLVERVKVEGRNIRLPAGEETEVFDPRGKEVLLQGCFCVLVDQRPEQLQFPCADTHNPGEFGVGPVALVVGGHDTDVGDAAVLVGPQDTPIL